MLLAASETTIKLLEFAADKGADLVVGILGTLLGFVTAILLYLREVNDNKKEEELAAKQRHLDHMRWFSGILGQVIRYANMQADQLQLFVDRIKGEPAEHHHLAFIVSRSTERLVQANNESTFHAYSTVFGSNAEVQKEYLRLLGVTDYITVGTARVKEVFGHYTKGTYKRQLKLKKLIENSSNSLNNVISSLHDGGPNAHLLGSATHAELGALMNRYNWLIDHGRPTRQIIEEFIQPLKKVILAHQKVLDFGGMWVQLKNATVTFTDIERDSLGFLAVFSPSGLRDPAERLGKIHDAMQESIKKFEATMLQ